MIKNIVSYFSILLSIFAVLFFSSQSNTSLDIADYSTQGLDLCYNVVQDEMPEEKNDEFYLP